MPLGILTKNRHNQCHLGAKHSKMPPSTSPLKTQGPIGLYVTHSFSNYITADWCVIFSL